MANEQIEKGYDPKNVESKWYDHWLKRNYFAPALDSSKPPFSLVIPPPNVTGVLHMGHALNCTIQDIMARYKRMSGYDTLWIPGMDHAGISTQIVVEKQLSKEGIKKEQLGREKFIERVWKWKEQSGGAILEQQKRLGISVDWSKSKFTLDEDLSFAVKKVFVDLHNDGLIYRGNRLVNWCPRCQTAVSDLEVKHQESKGTLWHIHYPGKFDTKIIVATTRPETLLGDSAVAVHPSDDRYKNLVGKVVSLPLTSREIKIIADDSVEKDFGSGVVKITPAHDFNDYETGQRHNLTFINIFAAGPDTPDKGGLLIPMVMLSLFTLSAAVMGYLFVSEPLMMYFDGKKKEAVSFFLTTVASFAAVTLVLVAILFSFSQGWLW
jgi:valyl-tRNA synthetase